MGSGAMTHIPVFIKIGSNIQQLIKGICRHTQHGELVNLFSFLVHFSKRRLELVFIKLACI
jgi:hypothetical protein